MVWLEDGLYTECDRRWAQAGPRCATAFAHRLEQLSRTYPVLPSAQDTLVHPQACAVTPDTSGDPLKRRQTYHPPQSNAEGFLTGSWYQRGNCTRGTDVFARPCTFTYTQRLLCTARPLRTRRLSMPRAAARPRGKQSSKAIAADEGCAKAREWRQAVPRSRMAVLSSYLWDRAEKATC